MQKSLWRASASFAIGGGLGLFLGLLTGTFRTAETLLDTTIQMVRNILALALIPLVILWFGIEESSKLFLVSIGVFFPVYLNTFHGIRSVDRGLVEMAKSYGLSGWPLYRDVILPGALPSILVGVRFSLGLVRALVHDADLLLLDEPLGALDALTRIEMQQLIASLWRERGFMAVLVTHDVQEAIALADRVVLIEDGRITLDEAVSLPRPRARGQAAFAALEDRILSHLLQHPASAPDAVLGDLSIARF